MSVIRSHPRRAVVFLFVAVTAATTALFGMMSASAGGEPQGPPPQPPGPPGAAAHEAWLPIPEAGQNNCGPEPLVWWFQADANHPCTSDSHDSHLVGRSFTVDAANYPSDATFTFEAVWSMDDAAAGTRCVRVFDLTADVPVSGSELCVPVSTTHWTRQFSQPFALVAARHDYAVQVMHDEAACTTQCPTGVEVRVLVASWPG